MANLAIDPTFSTRREALAHCKANQYPYGIIRNGVELYGVAIGSTDEPMAKVRSERHVYTTSGKKHTNKQVCVAAFAKAKGDRNVYLAAVAVYGVKPITANTLWNDIKAGRVA